MLPAVANDPDRLARFSREAQVLASLNHPNIAAIYGIEEARGVTALVMELVEGEDLSQRIARGAIPIDEVLPIARQIAEALEAAHDHGIIHRDLKPANIKLRSDGTVKILDFGLAKQGSGSGDQGSRAANSPTLFLHATQAGIILGTAAYMSPEQARGAVVDRRADVWAFGVILFEMLTAAHPFGGDTLSDTLASVLKTEPPWETLPAGTPPAIRRLMSICLRKDTKTRLRDIGEARRQIDDVLSGDVQAPLLAANVAQRSRSFHILPWAVAGVLGIALVLSIAILSPSQSSAPRMRALLTTLAFVGQLPNKTQLYVRRLDELQAAEVPGTEGAQNPFFSPDSQWIAFFAGGKLRKVPATGGAAQEICAAVDNRGGTWTEDGTIIFAPTRRTLARVSEAGGTPVAFGDGASADTAQRWPQGLPDGRWLAYQSNESGRFEISVRPFPNVDAGHWTISTGGGTRPLWARSGTELFYLDGGGAMTRVPIHTGPTFSAGTPTRVFGTRYFNGGAGRAYDVSPDGQRFLMIKAASPEQAPSMVVVLNWLEELKAKLPAK